MRIAIRLLTAGLVALLAGCTAPIKPDPEPTVVKVEVKTFVAIDAGLTQPCPVAMPADRSGGELIRVARERRAALEACNRQLHDIQALQPKEKQP